MFPFGRYDSTRKWNERSTRSRMKKQDGRSRTSLDYSPQFLQNTCNFLSKRVHDVFLTIMRTSTFIILKGPQFLPTLGGT